jgi:hypothetical protein
MTLPGHQDMAAAAELETAPPQPQPRLSRRAALRTAATAGVAVTALAATAGPALAARRPAQAERDDHGHSVAEHAEADPGEPIIAHLRDARTGEIDVFRGTSRVRLHDPALAALLVSKSR